MFEPGLETFKKEKIKYAHPLEKTIKEKYSKYMKYVHNSIKNPDIPPIHKKKVKDGQKLKFTIYGIRTSRAFIYCVHLVNGLYKYKSNDVDSPVIRGVTNVEWPVLLKNLQFNHGDLMYCLTDPVAVFLNGEILGGLLELKELSETKYNYFISLDFYKLSVEFFANFVKIMNRPCAYMHISIDDKHIGTLIFMLYADLVPLTCENFLRLCNTTRGGYSGTPIHRIVKEGWIQGGGFGLKSAPLDCENFIVPHDHRGVLAMANAERHVDCSTQFFVLLQPAPWMTYNYVAFGQLIDGEETLRKIENVETYYESPKSKVIIEKAGILNLDCQYMPINKETNAYIQGHIEDLIDLGKTLWEELLERVFKVIEQKEVNSYDSYKSKEPDQSNVRKTKRFFKKGKKQQSGSEIDSENNDFAVDSYVYEIQDYKYSQVTPSLIVPDEEPYYIPLTDVLYPGDNDSTYDLKKYLRGDYCLEADLNPDTPEKVIYVNESTYDPEVVIADNISIDSSIQSLNSDDAKEVKQYLKYNSDKDSFSGNNVKEIARNGESVNIENAKLFIFTDEGLRKLRMFTNIMSRSPDKKKVSMALDSTYHERTSSIKRRPTGFIRTVIDDSDTALTLTPPDDKNMGGSSRKVRIAGEINIEKQKPSVMQRLFEEASGVILPALKDCGTERQDKYSIMTYSPDFGTHDEGYHLHAAETAAFSANDLRDHRDQTSLEHPKCPLLKINKEARNCLQAYEYTKKRPTLTVSQYQEKYRRVKEETETKSSDTSVKDMFQMSQDRLPGDTPIYSDSSVEDCCDDCYSCRK